MQRLPVPVDASLGFRLVHLDAEASDHNGRRPLVAVVPMADDQLVNHHQLLLQPPPPLPLLHALDSALVDRRVEVVDSYSAMAVVRIVDDTDKVDSVDTVAMDGRRIAQNNMVSAVVRRVRPEKIHMEDALAFRHAWAFLMGIQKVQTFLDNMSHVCSIYTN